MPAGQEKIWIVDDEDDTRNVLFRALEALGYDNILDFSSAIEAIGWATDDSNPVPDFIFTDFKMPKMNGKKFLEKIRGMKKYQNVLVVLTTGNMPDDIVVGKEGFVAVLKKPFLIEDLSTLIANINI